MMADQHSDSTQARPGMQTPSDNAGLGTRSETQGPAGEVRSSEGMKAGTGSETSRSRADLRGAGIRMGDEAKHYAEGMTGRVKEQGRSMFERKKATAAAQVDSVAQAIRSTAGQLQTEDQSPLGRYIGMAAEQLESFGHRLREKDLDTLFKDAGDLARRSPGAFFAGSVVAGFLFSRFLKSSAQHRDEESDREYDPAYSLFQDEDLDSGSLTGRTMYSGAERGSVTGSALDDTAGNDNVDMQGGKASASESTATGIGADGTGTDTPSSPSSQTQSGGGTYGNR